MKSAQSSLLFVYSGYFYSIAPLQVHYYSEALPTQHGYSTVSGFHAEAPQATASGGLAQGQYVAARAGFESMTLQMKGAESTNEPPRPTALGPYLGAVTTRQWLESGRYTMCA